MEWSAQGSGVILDDSPMAMVTEVISEIDAGDHLLVMLQITELNTLEDDEPGNQPIVFQQSIFRSMNA